MKGIYITSYDLKNNSDGVSKKINYQIDCMNRYGNDVKVFDANSEFLHRNYWYSIRSVLARLIGDSYLLTYLLKQISVSNELLEADYLYIRKDFCNRGQIRALIKIKKRNPKIKIIVEYPTFPYDAEVRGRRRYFVLPLDKHYRKKMKYCIDRAVTYSSDKELFSVKCINISNAIDYKKVSIKDSVEHDGINMIAVALFGTFHGYDRLIRAMGEQIQLVIDNNVKFHLVGDGYAINEYKRLVLKYNLEEYVLFYGRLYGTELDKVYSISDIAVDNLGRHRVGCFYNSSLKGKEYGAKGIPIISGVETELDKYNEDFYYRVSADEQPIDLKEIIAFYHHVYDGRSKKKCS